MTKKRILFVNEFSQLATGFSTYSHAIMKRLHATDKYEIAELASYVSPEDPRIDDVPWKVYPVIPARGDQAGWNAYNTNREAQFGSLKFTEALLDFKPDICWSLRDHWMDSFVIHHPLRNRYRFIHMPTIDGEPQRQDWLHDYRTCDVVTTYSEWAKNLLENNKIKVANVTSPAVDEKTFCPPKDRKKQKESLGLNPEWFIVQTVMRNQPRKLFPDLFKSFAKYLELCKLRGRNDLAAKTHLHIHTSLEDVGWDIGAEIQRYHLGHKVLLTYMDQTNGQAYLSFYKGKAAWSRASNTRNSTTTNTGRGVSKEQLAEIMKCADLYVQYSICEGFGMPPNDAKACGVPIMGLPYSAVAEQTIQPGGIPLKITGYTQEAIDQTSQRRAVPDNDYTANELYKFFAESQSYRDKLGSAAREWITQNQTWDICSAKWERIFDSVETISEDKAWTAPFVPFQPRLDQIPFHIPNDMFVYWAIENLTGKFWVFNLLQINQFIKHLNDGMIPVNGQAQPFTKQHLVQHLLQIGQQCNKVEEDRWNRLCNPTKTGFQIHKG